MLAVSFPDSGRLAHPLHGIGPPLSATCHIELAGMLSGNAVSIDDEPVIPHLYAAGEVVGGYVGAERGHGKISIYETFGRIAGKAAAAEADLP